MSKRLMPMLAGVAALAIFIAGCGGGDDSATGDTTEEVQLTKVQLIKQADATCEKQNETLSTHFGKFTLENPVKNGEFTQAQSKEFNEQYFVPYVESRIVLLEGFNPPAADEKDIEAIVAVTEDGLEQTKENVESGKTTKEDLFGKAETLSRKFGFKICGET